MRRCLEHAEEEEEEGEKKKERETTLGTSAKFVSWPRPPWRLRFRQYGRTAGPVT